MEDRIAAAARESFARDGWAGTTLRGVAKSAGVDPALVHYYFRSKEVLLDASTMPPTEWLASIARANAHPLPDRGEAIVRNLVWTWGQPHIMQVLGSILLTAAHEPRVREKLVTFMTAGLLPAVADQLDDEQRLVRAALISSHLFGLTMMRWVWKIEPIASWPDERVVSLVTPTIQRYLDGILPNPGSLRPLIGG
jgi:AcrR family transcriptional regulator